MATQTIPSLSLSEQSSDTIAFRPPATHSRPNISRNESHPNASVLLASQDMRTLSRLSPSESGRDERNSGPSPAQRIQDGGDRDERVEAMPGVTFRMPAIGVVRESAARSGTPQAAVLAASLSKEGSSALRSKADRLARNRSTA